MPNRYMQRCSTSVISRDMQIKTTVRYHFIPIRLLPKRQRVTSAGKDVVKRKRLNTVGGNVNWYRHYEKNTEFPPKIKNKTII